MGFLLIPITLQAEHLCIVSILYTKCPPPSSFGRRYSASKVLMLSILLDVAPLTAYTNAPGGYDGSTSFLPIIIYLGDITGWTPPFLLIELTILTVDITNSLINLEGIRFIFFGSMDLTHLILSLINLIPRSTKCTCAVESQHIRYIPCSFKPSQQVANALSAYIIVNLNPLSW